MYFCIHWKYRSTCYCFCICWLNWPEGMWLAVVRRMKIMSLCVSRMKYGIEYGCNKSYASSHNLNKRQHKICVAVKKKSSICVEGRRDKNPITTCNIVNFITFFLWFLLDFTWGFFWKCWHLSSESNLFHSRLLRYNSLKVDCMLQIRMNTYTQIKFW